MYGDEVDLYVLRVLLNLCDLRDQKSQKDKDQSQTRLAVLAQEITNLSRQTNFAYVVCQALETLDIPIQEGFLTNFIKLLPKLSLPQEFSLGLALVQSVDNNIKQEG